ncbi:MAG: hypothetical protein IH898_04925, partial [Planctomycetes bacterium]|nr:hypothetical protein [Planctomycetota bacterium]
MSISKIIESSFRRFAFFATAAAAICLFTGVQVCAQLQVTEVMVDPLDENVWEWIEVYNPDPNDVDLHGAFGDRLGDPRILSTDPPSIDNAKAFNTIIPAGGVAVLYDANLPGDSDADFNDQLFRDAWGLPGTVPLIGVDFFPTLTNSGSSIGFWEDYTAYALDLVNPGSGFVVDSFDHALFGIDFRSGFPVAPNGTSMRWNGQGSYQSGVNWTLSSSGVHGAVTSVPALIQEPINSTSDLASPGVQPAGGFRPALIITELMASPASDEPDWEWIEVFNGTGDLIDFAEPNMNFVLDDTDGGNMIEANITSGSIANGEIAVLYNGDAISFQNIQDAWDPNGSNGTNFIPVSNFSELATAGTVALWERYAEYDSETFPGPGRSTYNAVSVLN